MNQTASASRSLGLWSATALVVGHTIAVGIFLTPAEIIGALASPALTVALWMICGLLVLAGALTFGELAARYPMAGGPYIYLREGWGERLAFLYGWQAALILDPGITAALAAGFSEYVIVVVPSAAGLERWIAVAIIWLLALVAMAGVRLSTRTLTAMTALKVLVIVGIIGLGLTVGSGSLSHFVPAPRDRLGAPPLPEALAAALVGIFFSFGGFWEASRVAGEIKQPERTLPRALALGVGCVTALYVMMTCVFIYLVPVGSATSAQAFAARAGTALLGARGPQVFASVVILSVAVSMLALLVMAPRMYVAMADDGLFPRALGSMHHPTRTPLWGTILVALLASGFAAVGTFQQIVAFFICTAFGFIALAAGAIFVVRGRSRGSFQVPGYPFTPALFVLLIGVVVVLVALNRPVQAGAGFALLLLGWPVHALLFAPRSRVVHRPQGVVR